MNSLAQSPGQNHDRIGAAQALLASKMTKTTSTHTGGNRDGNGVVEITAVQKMVSAMSGSLLTSLLVTPLDVVRVRLQSQVVQQTKAKLKPVRTDVQKIAVDSTNAFRPANLGVTACCREVFFMNNNAEICLAGPKLDGLEGITANTGSNAAECMVEQTQKKTINSTFDGMRKIARNEGVTALWRGLSPTLLMAIPANIIYFTGYDWLRYHHQSPIARVTRDEYAPLVAGSFARLLAVTAVSPIELFRTRLQATTGVSAAGHLLETFRSVEEMVKQQGYRSLWRGLTLTLWRDVPFSGIYWWGYESIRNKLTDTREKTRGHSLELERSRTQARRMSQSLENHAETFVDSFAAGAISGAVASIVTMPFDVGKTRTQIYQNESKPRTVAGEARKALAPEERSMVRLLWHIFKTEGAAGLWKGWVPRTLKVAPACAIMISSYEVGKRAFRSINQSGSKGEQ